MEASRDNGHRPLEGVRILDLTSVILGPYATQILGDLGADVVKIEQPGAQGGDLMRWAGSHQQGGTPGMGPLFMTFNRNKRSVALDMKSEADRATLLKLAERADVFATNLRMVSLEAMGVGYDALKAARPDIVYVHACGFGSDGPYGGLSAYDDLIQAASGIADLHRRTHDDERPRYVPMLAADKTTGLFMVYATLAALYQRAVTGEGQFVEVPMFECMTHFNMSENLFGHGFHPPVGQIGYNRTVNPDRKPYRTKDGWIGVTPYTDRHWRDFFALAGRERDFSEDARFNSYQMRMRNIRTLYAMLEEITVTRTTDEWLALCATKAIPAMRVNSLEELLDDPHLKATDFFPRETHPSEGPVTGIRQPVRFGAGSTDLRQPAPRLGEHNDDVLKDWGVEPE